MKLTLLSKHQLAGNAWRFQFQPEIPLKWEAGQFIWITLRHSGMDAAGASRQFTIAAAPHEAAPAIVTRLTGTSFKRALGAMGVGDDLELADAPAGDFVWREAKLPHLFCAQGIGITPFYAIVGDRIQRGLPVQATLIYASQPGSAIIFEEQLAAWAAQDPTFVVKSVTGTLAADQIAKDFPDYAARQVYVSGPKSFMRLAISPYTLPLKSLHQDNFPGYAAAQY